MILVDFEDQNPQIESACKSRYFVVGGEYSAIPHPFDLVPGLLVVEVGVEPVGMLIHVVAGHYAEFIVAFFTVFQR